MRLTFILLIAAIVNVSAKGISQTVSFKGKNVSLQEVFAAVKKQTGFTVVYNATSLEKVKPVSLNVTDLPLTDFLQQVLLEQPLDYSIKNTTIFISRKASLNTAVVESFDQQVPFPIRGKVLAEDGTPLVGASVAVKNTKTSGVTNAEGIFSLNVSANDILIVSFVGFETQQTKVLVTNGPLITITLKRNDNPLDKIQIIAYGSTSQRFSVGSSTTVNAETIEKQPVSNVLLALQGQVPGLAINATSGVPGSRVQLQIRGQNTISFNAGIKPYDQPLFIVDGVPFAPQNNNLTQLATLAQASSFSGGISQYAGLSPFNSINPADIESVSILKDADATSIYGSQGSNGVVLITTKKGKAGKTTFNLAANTGFNSAARQVKLLNTPQYLQLRKEAFAADNVTPTLVDGGFFSPGFAPDLLVFDQNKYTDWQHVITGKTSNTTDIHGTLSGGTANNTFLFSGGYTRSNYNFPGDYADQRFTLHSNLHHSSANNQLTIDFGNDFGYDENNSPGFGGGQRVLLPPNTPDLLDAQGNLLWKYQSIDLGSYQFYGYLKNFVKMQNYNLNNTLRLSYKILPGLNISANLGYSRTAASEHSENPGAGQKPAFRNPTASFTSNTFQTLNAEPQIDYVHSSRKGVFTALLGATYKKGTSYSTNTQGTGYANDKFLGSINGAATKYSSDGSDIYKYGATFARLKYVYDQKYIVSLTGRRDGSSYFGPGHQFGSFGSAGVAWIFSEEKLLKNNVPFISYGKLSGSYGTAGSNGIQSYQYQAFWRPLEGVPAFQNFQPNVPINLFNPVYNWALKKSLNLAMDIGFFQDRLLLNATYYRGRTGNQLGATPLPGQVGLTTVVENLPATLQNSGWEFSLNSTNVKSKTFRWTSNFNISFNRNKLLEFPNLEASPYRSLYAIGKPTSIINAYRFKGVNETTGLFEYYTKDGKVTNSPKYGLASTGGDLAPIINREVKYMGGLGNTLSYKNFSLYFFFQFASQTAPNYLASIYGSYTPGLGLYNLPVEALNYWKKPGDHTELQKLTVSYFSAASSAVGGFGSSTGAYSKDTYARLKTVSLTYQLPGSMLKKAHIQNASIYANAQNLLTITNFKVGDPELGGDFSVFPLQRVVVFGLNFNF